MWPQTRIGSSTFQSSQRQRAGGFPSLHAGTSSGPLLSLEAVPPGLRHRRSKRWALSFRPTTAPESPQESTSLANLLKPRQPGDVGLQVDTGVALTVEQPRYSVRIAYKEQGRLLQGAAQIWAHVGHSGWRDTHDVELQRVNGAEGVWVGEVQVPAQRLNTPTHLEVQLAFKGKWTDGRIAWDNNANHNWSSGVELAPQEGLVTASASAQSQATVSSLILRIESLRAQNLLTHDQATMLRTLAWSKDFTLLKTYERARGFADPGLCKELTSRLGFLRRPGLHVVHIAVEMHPIVKVGGLADVVSSLAKAHQARGTLAEIILPKYDCINYSKVEDLRQVATIQVPWATSTIKTLVWSGVAEGLPVYFLEPHSKDNFFWRKTVYGCPDDVSRFLWFSRAALEFLAQHGKQPDVIHIHDWQTAAVAPMLKELYKGTSLGRTGSVLTIHNLAFQGRENANLLELAGFERKAVHTPDKLQDELHKCKEGVWNINWLKGGIVYADQVTTVSNSYANEVLQHNGEGLQGVLWKAKQAGKFHGVLNGIDVECWDPKLDKFIPQQYTADTSVAGKLACKQKLLAELGLPFQRTHPSKAGQWEHSSGRPLLAVISRLTEQKGLPLILRGLEAAVEQGAQVVILGSAPDKAVQQQFEKLQQQYGSGPDARIVLRFDEGLSHRIYAGADMILIPSAFEPCGLTQLISLRYGTVPIVRPVGGLADTVYDVFYAKHMPENMRNGYYVKEHKEEAVDEAIKRAVDGYWGAWDWWSTQLVPRCMNQDWSWEVSAGKYLDIYHALANVPR